MGCCRYYQKPVGAELDGLGLKNPQRVDIRDNIAFENRKATLGNA